MPGALNVLSLRVLVPWVALCRRRVPTFRGDDDQHLAALLMQPFKSTFTAGADSPDGRAECDPVWSHSSPAMGQKKALRIAPSLC